VMMWCGVVIVTTVFSTRVERLVAERVFGGGRGTVQYESCAMVVVARGR